MLLPVVVEKRRFAAVPVLIFFFFLNINSTPPNKFIFVLDDVRVHKLLLEGPKET